MPSRSSWPPSPVTPSGTLLGAVASRRRAAVSQELSATHACSLPSYVLTDRDPISIPRRFARIRTGMQPGDGQAGGGEPAGGGPEEVLYAHPAVREAAVIVVPPESLGEQVGSAVVLKEGQHVTTDEPGDMKQKVAAYKYARDPAAGRTRQGRHGEVLKREIEVPDVVASKAG